MKQVIEGYLFNASGAEFGPTIMKWIGKWNKAKYEKAKEEAWCNNDFLMDENYNSDNPKALEVELTLIPGKKYRLIVEEI